MPDTSGLRLDARQTLLILQKLLHLNAMAGRVGVAEEQAGAIGAEDQALHGCIKLAGDQEAAAEDVPQADGEVVAGAGQVTAVGAEGDGVDAVGVTLQLEAKERGQVRFLRYATPEVLQT